MGIDDWVWIDKKAEGLSQFEGKSLIGPERVNPDYYVFISSHFIDEIGSFLENKKMYEWDDWIYAIERAYYEGLLEHPNDPLVPELLMEDLNGIEDDLKEVVKVIPYEIEKKELEAFAKSLNFEDVYRINSNKRYRRKIMEYFITEKLHDLSSFNENDVFLDLGAAGSPFAKFLHDKRNISAFALDLEEGEFSQESYYLCEDATRTHFKDNSVSGASMHSSFEMFLYNADTALIQEMARVLKKDSKLVIAPLYMHKQYLSTCSPNNYGKGYADDESLECIRTDCWSWIPLARFYDVRALEKRVLTPAREHGLMPTVYSLPDDEVEKDEFVYLKFILELKKQ
ncbi:Methyltransferase domain-containing protein [Butyrivibrio proteoclasticus]|uniref:Methyltransferase domain-containing protein n=2 Tax=Butyrivibrio proteoclasticus TaxID=43305 RepID=A0A1I5VWD1_9FIRM|nr:Methyltransferase domain-containing protein [Butyrivibrio proteoclasticus]